MRHAYLSSSSSLPNMIKLSQTVWKLWPAQDFGFRGDNYIMTTVRVVSLAHDTTTGPPLHSYQIKYYQSMSKGIKVMERTRMRLQYFCFRGDNYIMNKVRVVSLAWDMPTGLHLHPYQISNYLSMGVMACTDFGFRGDNYIMKTVRVVSLACAYWSSSTFLPNIIKISPRVSKLWSAQGCVY